jgi:hypothetical protein
VLTTPHHAAVMVTYRTATAVMVTYRTATAAATDPAQPITIDVAPPPAPATPALSGTPDVWALPAATRALLDARLAAARRPPSDRAAAHLLRGLVQWCIRPPSTAATITTPETPAAEDVHAQRA